MKKILLIGLILIIIILSSCTQRTFNSPIEKEEIVEEKSIDNIPISLGENNSKEDINEVIATPKEPNDLITNSVSMASIVSFEKCDIKYGKSLFVNYCIESCGGLENLNRFEFDFVEGGFLPKCGCGKNDEIILDMANSYVLFTELEKTMNEKCGEIKINNS